MKLHRNSLWAHLLTFWHWRTAENQHVPEITEDHYRRWTWVWRIDDWEAARQKALRNTDLCTMVRRGVFLNLFWLFLAFSAVFLAGLLLAQLVWTPMVLLIYLAILAGLALVFATVFAIYWSFRAAKRRLEERVEASEEGSQLQVARRFLSDKKHRICSIVEFDK